ncbi:penicillin-binding protein [Arcanobacterium haemolyticum]|nr:penicillin-binding protein [Arcanobacterium haemolyticum]
MNRPIRQMASLATVIFLALMAAATAIQYFQAPSLNADSRNVRTLYREYGTNRGQIIVSGTPIVYSQPSGDAYKYQRVYDSSGIYSNLTGYFSTSFNSMTGIERAMNPVLGGSDDSLTGQRLQELLSGTDPAGGSVELTIESKLQEVAVAALAGRSGAVVALNPQTGAILAQVTSPSYDANLLATHDSAAAKEAWASLNEDPNTPLVDRSTDGDQYAPGSTFKMLTAVAMLENTDGLTPDSLVEAPTSWTLPQSTHAIYNPGRAECGDGSGQTTLRQAFIQSCNTAFAIGGVGVGVDKMISLAEDFGFGTTIETPLSVSSSRFPAPESDAALAMDSFGQQDVRVTPMQMAMITSAIANKGTLMKPYLVSRTLTADLETISETKPIVFSTPLSEQTAAYMNDMMVADVDSGTGFRAAISGVKVAGKTGTAEIGGDGLVHAWFASYAPADDPQIAVVVLLDNITDGDGGSAAAPIARQVIQAKLSE